ncbi:hypothetical protein Bca52824_095930 [Brassica carinata]|uniref:JAB1/MPN/MOV34 metalloenzyme domain-containing protein n=1 Tax=Brassica carinata TaxID=52824 RepID=A0A8X7P2H2_BRACI|nr:hypothetical protein Bca52824_095930 [Brassica carinata]
MDVIKTQQISARTIEKVVVHPLVLLSIVDHYNRVARTRASASSVFFSVAAPRYLPFEEDDRDPSIWFLDHNYHESMFHMFKRINAKEHVIGWYSTGPKLRENDLDVHALFSGYVPNPVLVIIDVQPKELGIPTKAYYAVEEVKENATQKPEKIAAHEVEEIGVEHLLRDVKDTTISTLATEVTAKLTALKGLDASSGDPSYLDLVIEGKLPLNHEILYHLQDVFNLLPNLNVNELVKAFSVKTNDMMLVIYLSSLIRSVIAPQLDQQQAHHTRRGNQVNKVLVFSFLFCERILGDAMFQLLNKEHEKAEDSKPVAIIPITS